MQHTRAQKSPCFPGTKAEAGCCPKGNFSRKEIEMRLLSSLLLASALSLSAGTAIAACPDDAAAATGPDMTATAGIAKDGTHAPLEGSGSATAGDAGDNMIAKDGSQAPLQGTAEPGAADDQGANEIAKDGSTMPLAESHGGGNQDLATSQQDVEAQQEGEKTAAATAMDDECKE
jgi:hypothetical protein